MTHVYLLFSTLALGIGAFIGVVWMAERKGRAELRQEQQNEEARRLRETVEADARARERIARGELLTDDGFKRD